MKHCAATAAILLLLLNCGCRGAADAGRSGAGTGDTTGIVRCQGYTVIATQTLCRTVELENVEVVALAPYREADGLAEEDRTETRVGRTLAGLRGAQRGAAPFRPAPAILRPRQERTGTAAFGLDAALAPEPASDPIGSWGWLNADIQRAERAPAPRRTTPSRWLSIGTEDKDTLGDGRLKVDDFSDLNDGK